MSVRVVKEGKLPEQPIYTGTCPDCGCVIEAYKGDLDNTNWGLSCRCPTWGCGAYISCEPKSEPQRYVDTDKVKYQRGEE